MYEIKRENAAGALALAERLRRPGAAEEQATERLHGLLVLLVAEQARQTQLLREILAALRAGEE
jgi:hypothetical protein